MKKKIMSDYVEEDISFPHRLMQLCAENGMKRQELADKLNINSQSIYQYSSGSRFPSYKNQKLIADFFDVDIDYLMGRSNIRNLKKLKKIADSDLSDVELDLIKQFRTADDNVRKGISIILGFDLH